jgi:hypothetical protein
MMLWIGLFLLVVVVLALVFLLMDKKKTPSEEFAGENIPQVHQKMSFQVNPTVYVDTASNVLVPSTTCCTTLFSLVKSNLPDGSYFFSTDKQQYLDLVFIDLKGPASFFSVQLVPYQAIKRGWLTDDHKRFYQLLDNDKIYLGLALDQKTIQGYDLTKGIYASVDVALAP